MHYLANIDRKLYDLARINRDELIRIIFDVFGNLEVLIEPISVVDAAQVEYCNKGAEQNKD